MLSPCEKGCVVLWGVVTVYHKDSNGPRHHGVRIRSWKKLHAENHKENILTLYLCKKAPFHPRYAYPLKCAKAGGGMPHLPVDCYLSNKPPSWDGGGSPVHFYMLLCTTRATYDIPPPAKAPFKFAFLPLDAPLAVLSMDVPRVLVGLEIIDCCAIEAPYCRLSHC
eukprot:scaffold78633_cov33-Attheya_sp.AAC.1